MEIVLLGGRIIAKALYGQLAAENERRSIEREPAGSFSANVGKDRTIQRSRPVICFYGRMPGIPRAPVRV